MPPDGAQGDLAGFSVAVLGNTAIIGAIGDDEACPSIPGCNFGSAYRFELAPEATQSCFCPNLGPCGNNDDFGGFASSAAQGAVLTAGGPSSVALDSLRLEARWLPLDRPDSRSKEPATTSPNPSATADSACSPARPAYSASCRGSSAACKG